MKFNKSMLLFIIALGLHLSLILKFHTFEIHNPKKMSKTEEFSKHINEGYSCKGDYITLGGGIFEGEAVPNTHVKIPLKTLNRHGLIAGATGTGKTKTIQVLSEQLSQKGIPVLMMDIKGDFSGIAMPGEEKSLFQKDIRRFQFRMKPKLFQ